MNVKSKVENKEQFSVELVIEIGAEEFERGLEQAYKKNRGSISVPGFRKGKAPRKVIEGMYGSDTFYSEAVDELYPAACEEAIEAEKLDLAASPNIEIMEVGKEGLTFKMLCTVRPEVEISDYIGIEADKLLPTITDEMVETELKTYIDRATRLEAVERPATQGDTVTIDFEGFTDGIPFGGGKGDNFDLVLGSGSFIPGFEAQLIDTTTGQELDVNVTFPEDYHAEELKGKAAVFKVKVLEIKAQVLPELDDEFAKDVSEFETMEAFRLDLRAKVAERVELQNENRFKQNVLDKLADKVTIEVPAPMVEAQVDRMLEDYKSRLEGQGISLEMYYTYMQMTEQTMRAELRPGAEKQLRTQLALDAVAKAEKIVITPEEITAQMQQVAESVQLTLEQVKQALSEETFARDMARDRAMELVTSKATAKLVSEEDLKIEPVEVTKEDVQAEEKQPAKKPAAKKTTKKAETAEGEEKPKAKKTATKKTGDAEEKPKAKKTAAKKEDDGEAPAKKPSTRKKKTDTTEE